MDLSENEELTLSSYGDFRRENDDKGVEWGALFSHPFGRESRWIPCDHPHISPQVIRTTPVTGKIKQKNRDCLARVSSVSSFEF